MNWINIHTDDLRGEQMMGADPVERGTWLFLLAWCATQENDGCIKDCLLWKDRRWQQTCGVTKNEVHMDSDLYCFVGDDLVVNLYPLDKQNEVQRKRDQAKKNGRMGGRPKKTPPSETIEESTPKPTLVILETHVGSNVEKRKEKEKGKGKENGRSNIVSDETKSTLLNLWNNSPAKARNRSSKKKVSEAWKKIKTSDRPCSQQLVEAIKAWSLTEDWQNGYAPGLHLWIKDEKWQDLPEHGTATNQSIMGW